MSKRLLFYNIFLYKGGLPTNYPIERFFDDLSTIDTIDRYKRLGNKNFKLINVSADNQSHSRNRDLLFCKYREERPYSGQRDQDDYELIDSDILESTTMMLIPDSYLIVLAYNHYGPSEKVLENYVNEYINNNGTSEDEELNIKIHPIKTEDQIALIRNSRFIKSIDIEYSIEEDIDYSQLISGDYEDKSIVQEALESNAEVSTLLESQVGLLTLKKGRFRTPINMDEALSLISNINMNSDIIQAIKVTIKDAYNKDKVIDIKHNGLLYKHIDVDEVGYDYLRHRIREEYYNELRRVATNKFTDFGELSEKIYINIIDN